MDYNYKNTGLSEEEFEIRYQYIKSYLIKDKTISNDKKATLLGGQPGAGKSIFFKNHPDRAENYIIINGDDFRKKSFAVCRNCMVQKQADANRNPVVRKCCG